MLSSLVAGAVDTPQQGVSKEHTRSGGRSTASVFTARGLSLPAIGVLAVAILGTCGVKHADATPIVLDFEGLVASPWPSGPLIPASRLSDAFLSTYGVKFSSGSPFVWVFDLGLGHATSGTNAITGSDSSGAPSAEPQFPLAAAFFDPVAPSTPAVTDFVSLRGDHWGTSGLFVTLEAFDVHGNLLASYTTYDSGGETLSVSAPGIHTVRFLGTGNHDGVALDDFTFNPVTPYVPEPSSLALLTLALGNLLAYGRLTRRIASTRKG